MGEGGGLAESPAPHGHSAASRTSPTAGATQPGHTATGSCYLKNKVNQVDAQITLGRQHDRALVKYMKIMYRKKSNITILVPNARPPSTSAKE